MALSRSVTGLALALLALQPIPTGTSLYHEINRTGLTDIAVVALLCNPLDRLDPNEPATLFEVRGNGRVDCGDILALPGRL